MNTERKLKVSIEILTRKMDTAYNEYLDCQREIYQLEGELKRHTKAVYDVQTKMAKRGFPKY